jgi:hypothetical protein
MKKYCTDFLFGNNNFLIGMGSAFSLFGDYFSYNTSKSGQEADKKAMENDWGVVGQDIQEAISEQK